MKAFIQLYIFRSICYIMVAGGLHVTADYSRAQNEIFAEDVIQKWRDYEVFSHKIQGTERVQRIVNGKSQESTFQFKQNRECALTIGPHNRDPLLSLCLLGNSHYMAKLDLSKADPKHAVLHNYAPLPEKIGGLSPFEFIFIECSRHFSYGAQTLRQVVLDPSFKVTKTVKEIQNGQELTRIEYIYNYVRHVGNDEIHERRRGTLWLDPSRCWCIRRSNLSTEITIRGERISDTEADVVCETIDHPSGFPILKSVTEEVKILQNKNKRKSESSAKKDYELEVNENVPDSEFTLTAFGLPEPGSDEVKKAIPLYVWILVAAAISVGLAIGFFFLARRSRAKPVA